MLFIASVGYNNIILPLILLVLADLSNMSFSDFLNCYKIKTSDAISLRRYFDNF